MNEHICAGMDIAKSRSKRFFQSECEFEIIVGYDEFGDAFVSEMMKDEEGKEIQRDTITALFCPYCGDAL